MFENNVPPMVTTPGYTMGQQNQAPLDQNAAIIELLKRRAAAMKQGQLASGDAEMWQNSFQRPQFTQTVDGGRSGPDQVVVNWGDIIGSGVSNYMGAKKRREAVDKEDEVKQINDQFMQSTLGSDEKAAKLYAAVQAGVPGAGQALTEHLAPKKKSLGAITQFIQSGGSPEMAAEMAEEAGLDPQIAFRAAEYQAKSASEKAAANLEGKKELKEMDIEGRKSIAGQKMIGNTGYTAEQLAQLPIEERARIVQAAAGREPTEVKERAKLKVAAEQELPTLDLGIENMRDVINFADKATYYPGNAGLVDPRITSNSNNAMLKQAINQIVLDASGGKLGGGVSNADVEFLKSATAMLEAGNRDTVVAQLNRILSKLEANRDQVRRNAGIPTKSGQKGGQTSRYDYSTSKKAQAPADDFDKVWEELGGE